jgi:dimethylhistidine N-methyltransferase
VVQTKTITESNEVLAVEQGLSSNPKHLPSWMLYDTQGDSLFRKIMELPEYYPTRCETEILTRHKDELARYFMDTGDPFDLIELGAGEGTKTELLLQSLIELNAKFTYKPVDISESVLFKLTTRLTSTHHGLRVKAIHATYEKAFENLSTAKRKVLLFLGANIGNMTLAEASTFLAATSRRLSERDMMVIGFDLKKDPRIIHAAYDDEDRARSDFNLNLLKRLNRTLGAQFDLKQFEHYADYNPQTGVASSYIVSLKDQNVLIKSIEKSFHFSQWEAIHTEVSQKYDLLVIEQMLTEAGLEITDLFFDRDHFFCDVVAVKQ